MRGALGLLHDPEFVTVDRSEDEEAGMRQKGVVSSTRWGSPSGLIDGAPDFVANVHITNFVDGANGGSTTIHGYVNDASDHGGVQIISPDSLSWGTRSSRFARPFCEPCRTADQALRVADGTA
jgi:hypothetical protein